MRKRILLGFLITAIIFIVGLSIYLCNFNSRSEKTYIELNQWYNADEKEQVLEWNTQKISYSMPYSWIAYVKEYDSSLIEQIQKESGYLGNYSIYMDGISREGQLFFKNDCYYFGYIVDTTYCIRALICELLYENLNICFPFPYAIYVDMNSFPNFPLYFDVFFKESTFEETKSYYSMFSDYITIDGETQCISVKSNEIETQKKYEIVLDFINKTISINMEGEVKNIYTYIENRFETYE